MMTLFTFPNPVNEYAARTVAAGVVILCLLALALQQPWLLIPLAYGFWARVLTGPTLSPLGQFATRVIAPHLGEPRWVAGPPKRFAQAIGVVFSSTALILWFGFGLSTVASIVVILLMIAAYMEFADNICLGCKAFGILMKLGVIPEDICEACEDISLRVRTP